MSNMASEYPPEDVLNILIASDIHLGYAEKDSIRGGDTYTTFEEILRLAQEQNVDLILLGGDLFHDSKPTPRCIRDCISLIRQYCMGDRPVAVEFLSDQARNFRHCTHPVVNYEDPNFNISMPIFSIHGNHDDPSGYQQISSLDLISTSGLINYFGKWTDLTQVEISPLLMRKGVTRLALYGLSHLKDERLARLFMDYKVKMLRPREEQEDWFNIFVLHQNRADRGPKTFIAEDMLPDFLDLVVWGHEHECRIIPEQNGRHHFFVCQPGSSVATSLCEGEAVMKHVAILSIHKRKFQVKPIPLKTVRPFVFDSLVLADCTIDFTTEKPSEEVQKYVNEHLETLIQRSAEQISGDTRQPQKPLIRLRVEYMEEKQMFNAVRFGLQYTDRVANPSDIVLFRKQRVTGKVTTEGNIDKEALEALFNMEGRQGILGNRVEMIVEHYFAEVATDKHLQILSIKGLVEAASRFVDKDDRDALACVIDHQVNKTVSHLLSRNLTEDEIAEEIERLRQERLTKAEEEAIDTRKMLAHPSRQNLSGKLKPNSSVIDSDSDVDNEVYLYGTTRGGRGRGQATGTRARGGRGSRSRGVTPSRGRGRSKAAVQTRISDVFSQQQAKGSSRASSSGKRTVVTFDDDSDD
uniref:Double-strand break repair protein n=1 Tax=Reticulitermes speratus TaxID=60591 RepID=A0A2Z5U614_9NEOP